MTTHEITRRREAALPTGRDRVLPALEAVKPPTSTLALTLVLYLVGFGMVGALGTWATYGTIQGAVVASGRFVVDGKPRVVDHLEGGIVSDIRVRDGDVVAAGDVIAVLDGTRVRAQIDILQGQLAGALARRARLAAEADGGAVDLGPELRALLAASPELAPIVEAQQALMESTRERDAGEIGIHAERIAQLTERIAGIAAARGAVERQLALVQDEVRSLEELLGKGLVRRDRVIARQEDEIELLARRDDLDAQRIEVHGQIAEVRQQQDQVVRERQQAIADARQMVSEQILDLQQRIAATSEVAGRLEIRAPVAGTVLGMALNTPGAVVTPGQRLLEIVPSDGKLVLEAQISTADIDEIAVGGTARVRLSAYSYRKTPPVEGVVTEISADAVVDPALNVPFYRVRLALSETGLAALPGVHALPGMPAQVMIATREQTILAHLLDPVLGGLETALVENE
jgi:HlyD family type I secretion membrane fusion protein